MDCIALTHAVHRLPHGLRPERTQELMLAAVPSDASSYITGCLSMAAGVPANSCGSWSRRCSRSPEGGEGGQKGIGAPWVSGLRPLNRPQKGRGDGSRRPCLHGQR